MKHFGIITGKLILFTTMAFGGLCNIAHTTEEFSVINTQKIVRNYLDSKHKPKILAVGEGKVYNHYGPEALTLDIDPQVQPDVCLDITELRTVIPSVFPKDSFDEIHLRNLETDVFDFNASITFLTLAQLLKTGGTLQFNNMWGGEPFEKLLEIEKMVHSKIPEKLDLKLQKEYTKKQQVILWKDSVSHQIEAFSEARKLMSDGSLRDILFEGLLTVGAVNPFYQFFTKEEFREEIMSKRVKEEYPKQLKNFFLSLGFSDLQFNQNIWTIKK